MSFLGRKLTEHFQGDLVTDRFDPPLRGRIPGCRVKHRMKQNWLEMYNKAGFVLRVETVIHSPEEYRVRRRVRRGRRRVTAWVPLRKSVTYLFDSALCRRDAGGARGARLHQSGSTRRARPRGRAPGGRPQEMQRPSQSHAPSSARLRSRRQDPALSTLTRHALGLPGHEFGAPHPTHGILNPLCRCRSTGYTLLCKSRRTDEERIHPLHLAGFDGRRGPVPGPPNPHG